MNSEKLQKEFQDLKHNPLTIPGYTIELFNENIYKWKITLLGAKDTPYADGIFLIELRFPNDYPESAPEILFLTPIFHMNVYPGGRVCVNFIYNWKSKTSVREILTKLYSIFYLINPNSPCDREQAELYKNDRDSYYLRAEYFTLKYANIKSFEYFKGWDYSFFSLKRESVEKNKNLNNNEKIKLNFNINGGPKKYCIDCFSNMEFRELIFRIEVVVGFRFVEQLLWICEGRKLDEKLTIGENGLKNEDYITIITDVQY